MSDQSTGLLSPWLCSKRIEAVRPYLKGKVFDFGCGVGHLAALCNPEEYFGMDIDEESLEQARRSYPGFQFQSSYPVSGCFDTIVLLAAIEHIRKPIDLLLELKSRLNNCGHIILTTPHPIVAGIHYVGSKIGLFSAEANEQHEQLFDAERMAVVAAKTGLRISEYKRFLFGANQLFVLVKTGLASDEETLLP